MSTQGRKPPTLDSLPPPPRKQPGAAAVDPALLASRRPAALPSLDGLQSLEPAQRSQAARPPPSLDTPALALPRPTASTASLKRESFVLPPPKVRVVSTVDAEKYPGLNRVEPDRWGPTIPPMARALVVITHSPSAYPDGQIYARTRDVVDVVEYKKSPGGVGDLEWWNAVDSQWWIIRTVDGRVGRVPMTSLELFEESGKEVQHLTTGHNTGDSAKTGEGAKGGESWMMDDSEWNISACARIGKIFRSLKYNEWSKWAQLFALYLVVLECVAVFVWDHNESSRIADMASAGGLPTIPIFWDPSLLYSAPSDNTVAGLAEDAGCVADANGNFSSTKCSWIVDGEGEIEPVNLWLALGSTVIYAVFYFVERSLWGRNAESWADKMKATGPPKLLRAVFNWAVGLALVILQPSVCVAGWAVCAVALLATGATLKGDADKSVVYTARSNPVPFTFVMEWCKKKFDARKAAAETAQEQDQADADKINASSKQSWFLEQMQNDRVSKLVFMMVYLVINVALFVWWGYTQAAWHSPHSGPSEKPDHLSVGEWENLKMDYVMIFIAKGCGMMLNFNCALIAIPVTTSVLHYLHDIKVQGRQEERQTKTLSKYVPLGKNITFHRYIAYFIALCVAVHTLAHFVNYSLKREQALFAFPAAKCKLPGCGGLSFRAHEAWYTGIVIIVCMVLMYSAAQESVKRDCFNSFWMSHHLFAIFWLALIIHGPIFYWFALLPLPLYFWGRINRDREMTDRVIVEEIVIEPPNVMKIVMNNRPRPGTEERALWKTDKDSGLNYESGMYLKLCCPFLSPFEWHPFTISSAPEGEWLTCHIKVTRPDSWTGRLKKYLGAMNPEGMKTNVFYTKDQSRIGQWRSPLPKIDLPIFKVDGPHSAPCQHISEFRTVILVGAGIGLTPFASTICSLIGFKWREKVPRYPQTAYLHWSFRMNEFSSFAWFVRLLAEVRALYISLKYRCSDTDNGAFKDLRLEIHLYDTSRCKDDAERRKNATDILDAASCITPTKNHDHIDKKIEVRAIENYHQTGEGRPGQLSFNKGDVIELLSSTKRNSLLEGEEYLHGQLVVSPLTPNLVNTRGWFEASFVQEIVDYHAHDVIHGDVKFCPRPTGQQYDDEGGHSVEPRGGGTVRFCPRPEGQQYDDEEHFVESRGKRQLQNVDRGMLHVEFGRPSWDKVFPAVRDAAREAHPGKGNQAIGVFCCGPMGKALRAACTKYSVFESKHKNDENTVFKLHAEVF